LRELQEALAANRFSGFSVEHLTAYGSAIVVARK
jgi:hypothetical protein